MVTFAGPLKTDNDTKLKLTQTYTNGREVELVTEALKTGTLVNGSMLERFEHHAARVLNAKEAVALSTLNAALVLAAETTGLDGEWILLTTPSAAQYGAFLAEITGAQLRFLDIDATTHGLDPASLNAALVKESAYQRRVLVIATIKEGQPVDLKRVAKCTEAHDAELLTLASGEINTQRIPGSVLHDIGEGHALSVGQGALLTTDDAELAQIWRGLRDRRKVVLPEMSCALGIAQVERLARICAIRHEVAVEYNQLLERISEVKTPTLHKHRTWPCYSVTLVGGVERSALLEKLNAAGVESTTLRDQPVSVYAKLHNYKAKAFPIAEKQDQTAIKLPFYAMISPQQQKRVADAIIQALYS